MRPRDILTQALVGGGAGVLAILVLWCIWDSWDMEHAADRPPALFRLTAALRERLRFLFPPRIPATVTKECASLRFRPAVKRLTTTIFSRRSTQVAPDDVETGQGR